MLIMLILGLNILVKSSILVDYRFADNFGQVFHDYSGNSYHAVNGDSSSTTNFDTLPIDRGAYFHVSGSSFITLPPNDKVSTQLHLPSIFTIMLWVNSYDDFDYYAVYRKRSDEVYYFYMKRIDSSNIFACRIKSGTYSQSETKSPDDAFRSSNLYVGVWSLITMIVSGATVYGNTNGVNRLVISLPSTSDQWSEGTNAYSMTIGYQGDSVKSMQAIVWKFMIFNEVATESDYCGQWYAIGNCLLSTCPANCDPSIKIEGTSYCMSVNKSNNTLGDNSV